MTPLPPVVNVARVHLLWNVGPDLDVTTTQYWDYTGGSFSSGNAASMAAAIIAALPGGFDAYFTDQVKFTGVRVTDLSSDTGGDGTATADVVGTRSGGGLPASTAAVANYTIDRRYRGGKPKGFYPFGSESDLQGPSVWSDAALAAWLAAVEAIFAAINGASGGGSTLSAHVAVSYYSGFTVITSPTTGRARNVPTKRTVPTTYDVVSTDISTYLGTQRRRIRG